MKILMMMNFVAVFKKIQNNYGIKCKGFWEIIERNEDNAREKLKKEQALKDKAQQAHLGSGGNIITEATQRVGNLFGKSNRTSRNLVSCDYDDEKIIITPPELKSGQSTKSLNSNDSKDSENNQQQEKPKTKNRNSKRNSKKDKKSKKFKYISLQHLTIIFELLQVRVSCFVCYYKEITITMYL